MRIYLSRPRPTGKQAAYKIEAKSTSPRGPRLIQAMPKLSLTFSLLARSGPFLSFEKVAPWN
jgi:hypothetical protein